MFEMILAIVILILDQVTKYIVQVTPELHNLSVIDGFFHITYVRNTGAAWSMLEGQQAFLSLLAVVVIGVLLSILIKRKDLTKLYRISLVCMIAGAAGNLIDRLFVGSVRDFLNFYIFGYDFPIFNVADIALCVGVGLMILDAIIHSDKESK